MYITFRTYCSFHGQFYIIIADLIIAALHLTVVRLAEEADVYSWLVISGMDGMQILAELIDL